MTPAEVLDALETYEAIERGQMRRRKGIARALRQLREERKLSLRDVAPHLHITAATLSNLERGATWKAPTLWRALRYYEKLTAA
jgi:DNA-binding XRE family transcriptional regulator